MTEHHALSQLQEGQAALLETAASPGSRLPAILIRIVAGRLLVVRIADPVPAGLLPGLGGVTVLLPRDEKLWCLHSAVLGCTPTAEGALLVLRWPGHVEARPGRGAPRAAMMLPVRLRARAGQDRWIIGQTLDVSRTGLRCVGSADLRVGDTIEVEIDLAGDRVHTRAEVAWRRTSTDSRGRAYEMGLHFQELPETGRSRLDTLVTAHLAHAA